MSTIARSRRSAQVMVVCCECGDAYLITDRQHRRKAQIGRPHICVLCRAIRVKVSPSQAHRNYWLQRFTIEEIKAMAWAIWG